ncbi:MAG: SRPBCC domain-containing protein [Cytophagaceae bacterium]|nr:SRPBCC domain-containing protein [Cytophagaceae bacterium]
MSKELIVENSISIEASPSKVWDALTNPEQTQKYMFGCAALSDWKTGSPLLWQAHYEGKDVVFVKGSIVSIEHNKQLVYTTFNPHSTIEDIPENYLTVTYQLKEDNGSTTLKVTQGNYATVDEGERRYTEAYNEGEGWNPILVEIKKLVEGL